MPYFEPFGVEFDTVNTVNLKRILELCTVPDVGPSPLDPQLTVEMRCANALTTLEKTDGVFDEALYQDAVFAREVDEDWLDGQLLLRARAKSVPDSHFPALCMKHIPQCPAPMSASKLAAIPDPSKKPKKSSTHADDTTKKPHTAKSSQSLSARPPRLSINTAPEPSNRSSLAVPINWMKRGRDIRQISAEVPPRPQSPSSVFSSFSRLSSTSTITMRSRARDGFNSIFRREYRTRRPPPVVRESQVWSLSPTTTDGDGAPSLASRCDSSLLSSPSTSLSSRTSTSSGPAHAAAVVDLNVISPADMSLYSWTDSRILQKCSKNPRFIALRLLCVTEAKRFVDFVQHQRVVLPLFLGRSRMRAEGGRDTRLEDLKKKVRFPLPFPSHDQPPNSTSTSSTTWKTGTSRSSSR
jgi:hypothetical protein